MRYTYTVLLLIILSAGICSEASAQARLSLTTTSVSSSTPSLNTQLSIFTKLKNTSTTDTFQGNIDFMLANKDSIIYNMTIVGKPAFAGTVITLAPLEERSALFTVQLVSARFSAGPDIIIVWPVATVQVIDSARAPITIGAALGTGTVTEEDIVAYVAADQLYIRESGTGVSLREVRIFDMAGRLAADYPLSGGTAVVSLQQLPQGMYIADIMTAQGTIRRVKFAR